jgi:HSP20 family protein
MSRHSSPWTHWPPGLLDDFRRELGRLVENVLEPDDGSRAFTPCVNLVESDQGMEVTVDLPGVQPQDVQIEIKEGQLWISGERKQEVEHVGKTVHRIERRFGQFRRSVPLGVNADIDKVDARCKDGVLTITIPKSESAKPKRIEIK